MSPLESIHLHHREGERGQRVDFKETIADNSPSLEKYADREISRKL